MLNILFLIVCSLKIQTVLPEQKQVNELKAPSQQQFDNSINTVNASLGQCLSALQGIGEVSRKAGSQAAY